MHHWLRWLTFAAAALSVASGLRALWLLAQTRTPDPAPGEVQLHFSVGEATPRGDRLRLMGTVLLTLGVVLAIVARELV